MAVNFSIEGVGDLLEKLNEISSNVDSVVDDALIEAAETMKAESLKILKTPSIHHRGDVYYSAPIAGDNNSRIVKGMKVSKVIKGRKIVKGKYIKVYNSFPAAPLVEYGHSGDTAPAHPFLAPAFERKTNEASQIIKDRLIEALSK